MFSWNAQTVVWVLLGQFVAAHEFTSVVYAQESAENWCFSREALYPIWLSTTMHGESVLFVQDDPGRRPRTAILFQPTRILSVCNSSGKVTYTEGRDYIWKPGTKEIILPPESSISFQRPQDLRRPPNSQPYALHR